ncbi:hypothetical protein chiPu_0025562 [Chiloscyllium punctatum]|uniref:CARMIL C-terminal domain-containing protein n=1 Tax=Chiloscyllium punctatum TaxID=137246 RepID=A0A401TH91_CHIPU|nr:hypothetical protein [Chiloscyllium punctatum]
MSTSTTSSQRSQSLEGLSDLPTEGQKLQHQTRIRPKPHRNNRRPPRKTSNDQPRREEGNGGERKLDEGLENFYTWDPVTPERAG